MGSRRNRFGRGWSAVALVVALALLAACSKPAPSK